MKLTGNNLLRAQAGFNLVEVSLALAICAIGLIALIGLIPTGTDASRRASDDTMATSIANDLLSWPRIAPYGNTPNWPPSAIPLTALGTVTLTFDSMGNMATNEDTTVNQYFSGPYFSVTCTVMNHPQFPDVNNIARQVVVVAWPANAPAANKSYRYFVNDYARQ